MGVARLRSHSPCLQRLGLCGRRSAGTGTSGRPMPMSWTWSNRGSSGPFSWTAAAPTGSVTCSTAPVGRTTGRLIATCRTPMGIPTRSSISRPCPGRRRSPPKTRHRVPDPPLVPHRASGRQQRRALHRRRALRPRRPRLPPRRAVRQLRGRSPHRGSRPAPPSPIPPTPSPDASRPPAATSAVASVEREAKLIAPAGLGMPNLNELIPGTRAVSRPVQRLDATYYDTPDLRLARWGITVRHRGGEVGSGVDRQASRRTARRRIWCVVRFVSRDRRVGCRVRRRIWCSPRRGRMTWRRWRASPRCDAPSRYATGTADSWPRWSTTPFPFRTTRAPVGRFREVEVELHTNGAKGRRLLQAALTRLVGAGCDAEDADAQARPCARGAGNAGRPTWWSPLCPTTPRSSSWSDIPSRGRWPLIIRHDPGARMGDDDEEVHKLRVATRRLRSDLHSFGPLLDKARVRPHPGGIALARAAPSARCGTPTCSGFASSRSWRTSPRATPRVRTGS